MHHAFQRLESGNTAAMMWEKLSSDTTFRVEGGFSTVDDRGKMLGDVVCEFTSPGQVVHGWKSWEYLDY